MSKIKNDIVKVMHTIRADEIMMRRDSVTEVLNILNKLKMDYVIIEKKTLENHLMEKMKVSSQIDYSSIGASSIGKRFWDIEPTKMVNVKTNLSLEVNHITNERDLNYVIETFPNYAVGEIERFFDKKQGENK
ncbi:MAG: hypothetical protein RBR97_07155 [Bacteroidales bacterium]|nr:hypothetical protein [Bacteroidales bacterium]